MKRFISVLLALALLASMFVMPVSAVSVYPDGKTVEEAVADYEQSAGHSVSTHRYYFQMPNGENGPVGESGECAPTWYNDYTEGAGIYWWSGSAACGSWAGYKAMVADADQSIYYADVPVDVNCIIWNNGVDGGLDSSAPEYYSAAQTIDILSENPRPGEYDSIPEGADSYDNMIVVVDPDNIYVNELSLRQTCDINWYFYYGDGCYGSYAMDSESFESVEDNCLNPDHYVDGVHVHQHEEPAEDEAVIWYGGDSYYAHVGDTVDFTAYLDLSDCDVTSADCFDYRVNYDHSKLRLISDFKAVDGSSEAFPSYNDCTSLDSYDNTEQNRAHFNATTIKPWDFSERKTFIKLQFEVIGAGEFEMTDDIRTLACIDSGAYYFVRNGETVVDFDLSVGICVDCPHGFEPIEPTIPVYPTEIAETQPAEPTEVPEPTLADETTSPGATQAYEPTEIAYPESCDVTFHVKHSGDDDWTPYLWLWTTGDYGVYNVCDSWPGEDMGEPLNGWYSMNVEWPYIMGNEEYNFVLSANGSPQTADYGPYDIWEDPDIWIVIDDDLGCEVYDHCPDEPAIYSYYLIGSFTQWKLDEDYIMSYEYTEDDADVYYLRGVNLRASDYGDIVKADQYGEIVEWCCYDQYSVEVNGIYDFSFVYYGEGDYGYGWELIEDLTESTADEIESAVDIGFDEIMSATIKSCGGSAYFRFTPEEDMTVCFYSMADSDTYVYLYDSGLNELDCNDDGGKNVNFRLVCDVEAGKAYYFRCKYYHDDSTGSYPVVLQQGDPFSIDPVFATPDEAAPALKVGDTVTVDITEPGQIVVFPFESDAVYNNRYYFSSESNADPVFYLLDEDMNVIATGDDYGGENKNIRDFLCTCYLDPGKTYYLAVCMYYSLATGSLDLSIKADPTIGDIESISFEAARTLYAGMNEDPLTALKATVRFADRDPLYYDFGYGLNYDLNSGYNYDLIVGFEDYLKDRFLDSYDISGDTNVVGTATLTFPSGDESYAYDHTVEITTVENPVASIEVIGGVSVYASDYDIRGDWVYDEETGEGHYVYKKLYNKLKPDDVKVYYADGSTAMVSELFDQYGVYSEQYRDDDIYLFLNDPPYEGANLLVNPARHAVVYGTDQFDEEWTAGNSYTATVTYMGRTAEYSVEVKKYKPIAIGDSFSLNVSEGDTAWMVFTAESDSTVKLDIPDMDDGFAKIYDADMNLVASTSDDSAEKHVTCEVRGGETYYFEVGSENESYSYFWVSLTGFVIKDIELGDTKLVTVNNDGTVYFRFIPEEDMDIEFYSNGKDCDPFGWIYDENFICLNSSDDYNDYNFYMTRSVEAGKTYYLGAGCYGGGSGAYTVKLDRYTSATPDEPVPDEPYSIGYYLIGTFNQWQLSDAYRMESQDGGYVSCELTVRKSDGFNVVRVDQYGQILDWCFNSPLRVAQNGRYYITFTDDDGDYGWGYELIEAIGHVDSVVYFTNTLGWAEPSILYFDGRMGHNDPMEFAYVNGYGQDVYQYDLPTDIDSIRFGDLETGVMTEGLNSDNFDGRGWYAINDFDEDDNYLVVPWDYEPATPDEPEFDITVYYTNTLNWSDVCVSYLLDGSYHCDDTVYEYNNIYGQDVYSACVPNTVEAIAFYSPEDEQQTEFVYTGIYDGAGWYALDRTDDIGDYMLVPWGYIDEPVSEGYCVSVGDDLYDVAPGGEYTYEFRLNIGGSLTSIDATVYFDFENLEFIDSEFFGIDGDVIANIVGDGMYEFNYANAGGAVFDDDDDVLFRVTFKVNEDARAGVYEIKTAISDMSGPGENKIVDDYETVGDFYFRELITEVDEPIDYVLGDVDGDGVMTILDATRIQRYLVDLCNLEGNDYGMPVADKSVYAAADVTGDGVVSIFDALRIRRCLAGLCALDGSVYAVH